MNLHKFETLIFDLDGTLADTMPGMASAVRHVMDELECEKKGCRKPTDDFVRRNIGGGARNLLQKSFGEHADRFMPAALPMYLDYYAKNAAAGVSLYDGVPDTLDRLAREHRMAVVTAKPKDATFSILQHFDILKHFKVVITADDVMNLKPDPEGIRKILKDLAVAPGGCLLVGDTQTDVLAAKNAGVLSCVVTYGYGREQVLKEGLYDYAVDVFAGILEI